MGCDIHIHSEVKIAGKWHHYSQPQCRRSYKMFEKMAGVRGRVSNAIAEPRGIPKNATFITRFDSKHWGGDGHTHSWLSSKELADLYAWFMAEFPDQYFPDWDQWLFGNTYSGFHLFPEDRIPELQDVRFIFWFDN